MGLATGRKILTQQMSQTTPIKQVIKAAIFSRILSILICGGTYFLNADYDTSSSILHDSDSPVYQFLRWDSVYFVEIIHNGYTLEQQFAFDFGYPFLVRQISKLLFFVSSPMIYKTMISGILLSNLMFILSAVLLFYLSVEIGFRPKQAQAACCLYAFNPASIFMSSVYRESTFAAFCMGGMLTFERSQNLASSVLFALGTFTRSNGVLHSGFFFWKALHSKPSILGFLNRIVSTIIVFAPFLGFQYYCYIQFCSEGAIATWCSWKIPSITNYVQKHYWNNGFLNYFTLNNVPNFILAFPLIYLNSRAIIKYAMSDTRAFFTLGYHHNKSVQLEFNSLRILPYCYLTIVMLLICVLFMHVQVILRFFVGQPFMYWYLATIKDSHPALFWIYSKYFLVYGIVGAALFGAFLPPA